MNLPTITALGYLCVTSPRADDWRRFGSSFLGGQIAPDSPSGAVRVKFDDVLWRLEVTPGEDERVDAYGWLVNREEDLAAITERLAEVGIVAEPGSAELAERRSVNQLISFTDPWGFQHEVAWGQLADPHTFRPSRPLSGFVTGQQGLGHVLLMLPDIEAGHEFFSGTLGFQLSDKIIVPGALNARFYRVNARHHSLALAQGPPGVAGLHHLMVQVDSADDVGWAYDHLEEFDVPEMFSLGRHTNDRMFSFYCTTPSTFHLEYGFEGLEVDDAWVPRTYTTPQIWGHRMHPDAKSRPPGLMHTLPAE